MLAGIQIICVRFCVLSHVLQQQNSNISQTRTTGHSAPAMESESSSSEASSASSKNRSGTTSTKSSFLALVSEVPLVQSTLAKTSSVYSSTKKRNLLTKVGFSAAEVSLQTAFATTKFAYRWVPSFGVFGSLKEGIHKKGNSAF